MDKRFSKAAQNVAALLGHPYAFVATVGVLAACFAVYVLTGRSEVVIDAVNICISVFTLLALLILQNTQNRESCALHLIDELIRTAQDARDDFMGAEQQSDEEIERLKEVVTDAVKKS